MGYYSYKIEHDFGLAPNPFWGFCTLAVCKSKIRRNPNLKVGDWIIGTGSKKLGNLHYLIYLMQVEEIVPMNDYWNDDRFQVKKPIVGGTLVQKYGDNFYHMDDEGFWIQDDSAHSLPNGQPNTGHVTRDTGGHNVLVSKTFYYFGDGAILIPNEYIEICCEGRDIKSNAIPKNVGDDFIAWIKSKYDCGIMGDPISWSEYGLVRLDC